MSTKSSRDAVRCKERGRLRTVSWSALAPREPTPSRHTLGLAWIEGLLRGVKPGHAPSWRSDDVLWIEPELAERDPRVLEMWLASGALLGIDETREGDDRRELAPTVVIASGAYYERLARETTQRLERGYLARLARWALAHPANVFARVTILRPLRDQLGLARVRSVLTAELPDAATRAWFDSLGLAVRPLEGAVAAAPVEEALVIREARA